MEGSFIGSAWLIVVVLGPVLLAIVFGVGIIRSRRRHRQGPMPPAEAQAESASRSAATASRR